MLDENERVVEAGASGGFVGPASVGFSLNERKRMDLGVIAPLAAVIVTAVLGALGIAREQSAMRQLERVTVVLKEAGQDFEGRAELLWLQTALAKRLNRQYRAPRKRGVLLYGWAMRLAGWGLLTWVYFVLSDALFQVVLTDSNGQPRVAATWSLIISFVVLGVIGSVIGTTSLRRRERDRRQWLNAAGPHESDAPHL